MMNTRDDENLMFEKLWGSHGYQCNEKKNGNVTIMGQTQQFRLVEGIGEYLTTVSLKWKESVKV